MSKLTRFPAARVKKLIQADEDVGRMSSAVPSMMSSALELFLKDLCKDCETVMKAQDAGQLTPHILKQAVLSHSKYLFLRKFVETVPDPAPSHSAKKERPSAVSVAAVPDSVGQPSTAKRRKTVNNNNNSNSNM